jgi:peroxiredoxin
MTSRSLRLQTLALGVVIASVLSTLSVVAAGDMAAPSVEMRNAKGARVRLADFRGKVVLVKLWASWCPDCQAAFPRLDALQREFRSRGVEVIAVSVDESKKDAERFLETRPHQLNVMFDPRARVLDAFGALGVPTSYLIDRRGIIRYSHEGYDAATEAAYRRELETLLAEPLS